MIRRVDIACLVAALCIISLYESSVTLIEIGSWAQRRLYANEDTPTMLDYYLVTRPGAIPLVGELTGELGSVLNFIAGARAHQVVLGRRGIHVDLKLRDVQTARWDHANGDIMKCFPKLALLDYSYASTPEYAEVLDKQKNWLKTEESLKGINKNKVDYLLAMHKLTPPKNLVNASSAYPIPHFYARHRSTRNVVDSIYYDLKDLFEFNDDECCFHKPYSDEVVFHFRNFCREMKDCNTTAFREMSPEKVANELFAHLKPGDKVAISTRYGGNDAEAYAEELRARGLIVRIVHFNEGYQAFCFLKSAKRELVGFRKSMFFEWASYLGVAERIRIYSLDSPQERANNGKLDEPRVTRRDFWKHSQLKDRISDEFYESEEIEQSDLPRAPREVVGNPFLELS